MQHAVIRFALGQARGPADQAGYADSAFEYVVFHAPKWSVVAGLVVFPFAEVDGSIVAGVKYYRVFREAVLFECVQDLSDSGVHPSNHAVGEAYGAGEFFHFFKGADVFFWRFEGTVRRVVGYVEQKWLCFVPFDKFDGVLCKYVGEISPVRPFRLSVVFDDPVPVVHPSV